MVTSTCAGPEETRMSAAASDPPSQPSGRNVLMLTWSGLCTGPGGREIRTPGRPSALSPPAADPGAWNTQNVPVSRVIKCPDTLNSVIRFWPFSGGVELVSDMQSPRLGHSNTGTRLVFRTGDLPRRFAFSLYW